MILLNVGCGATRPPAPWVNLDNLYTVLKQTEQSYWDLRAEPNYVNHDVAATPWPFADGSVDGVLASHVLEHFDAPGAMRFLLECRRILEPGGVLRLSVPDAAYFRKVADRDTPDNWMELYGEGNHVGPEVAYRSVALFYEQHLQTYAADALWCQLLEAGFRPEESSPTASNHGVGQLLAQQDNRHKFSLFMEGVK